MLRRVVLSLSATLLLTACGASNYPYSVNYVSPNDVPAVSLPSPTVRGSNAYEHEIRTIEALQKKVTPHQRAMMNKEMKVVPEMVAEPVLGPDFNRKNLPATFTLLDKVGSDNWRISDRAKEFYNTKRPFIEQPERIHMLLTQPLYIPSYPSGHTTASGIWAETLSALLPRYSAQLHARADEVAMDRIRAGVHWPHDIAGGKYLVKHEWALIKTKPAFQADMAKARAELKRTGWLQGQGHDAHDINENDDPDAPFLRTFFKDKLN